MDKEIIRRIVELEPILFGIGEGDEPYFPMSIGNGWYKLVRNLVFQISHKYHRWPEVIEIKEKIIEEGRDLPEWIPEYFDRYPENPLGGFRITQIKEKFGGLRFYYRFEEKCPPEISGFVEGLVQMAESVSYTICEECGGAGESRQTRWAATLCDDCYENLPNSAEE